MPLAIKSMNLNRTFSESEYDSRIINYVNDPTININGAVRRTVGDNIVCNVYAGKRTKYTKNETSSVQVDSLGNYTKIIELKEGVGVYYFTIELLLDDGTYDSITKQIIYENRKPIINEFNIFNYDNITTISNENSYLFYSNLKNTLSVSFTSLNNDPDNNYFYKLWMSYNDEPEKSIPLNKTQNFVNLDISLLTNGNYYVYLKIIDSAGNVSFSRRKVSIFKTIPDVDINYIRIITNDYYISLSDSLKGNIKLLVNINAGIRIQKAELRLYKNNKIITYKSKSEKDKIDAIINSNIKKSGMFYFPDIDVESGWNLSEGTYQLELYFIDIFNREFASNRTNLFVKSKLPVLYSDQLDITNPGSLVLDENSTIDFSLVESFFKLKTKQIDVFMQTNYETDPKLRTYIPVGSSTSDWSYDSTNDRYNSKLTLFLNQLNINKVNDKFKFNYYEFRIKNDYGDVGTFRIPIVYKAERNKLILHEDFLFPKNNEFPTNVDGKNSYLDEISEDLSSATLLVPYGMFDFVMGFKLINEVDFGDLYFKTSNDQIIYQIDGNKTIIPYNSEDKIFLTIPLVTTNETTDTLVYPISPLLSFFTNENKSESDRSLFSNFNLSFSSINDISLPSQTFHGIVKKSNFLEPVDKDININHLEIATSAFNEHYQWLNFLNNTIFNKGVWKKLFNNVANISHKRNYFESFTHPFNIYIYKDLTNEFNDITLKDTIYDNKYDLIIPFDTYADIDKDLLFYIDHDLEYNSENVQESFNNNLITGKFKTADSYDSSGFKINDVPIYKDAESGDYIANVFYKYKNVDTIGWFRIYYKVNNLPLDINISLKENIIYKDRENSLVIFNNTSIKEQPSNIKIYANESLIYEFTPGDSDLFNIPINKLNIDGTKDPKNIYLLNSGMFVLKAVTVFTNTITNEERHNISNTILASVSNRDTFSSITTNVTDCSTDEEFRNVPIYFSSFLRNNISNYEIKLSIVKTHEFDINGNIVSVSNVPYTNYITTDKFRLKTFLHNFSVQDASEGLYKLDFTVKDLFSNNVNIFTLNIQFLESKPKSDLISPISSESFIYESSGKVAITLNTKKDFLKFDKGTILFFVTNDSSIVKQYSFSIDGYKNITYNIPLQNGDNKITYRVINGANSSVSDYTIPNTFVYSSNFKDNSYTISNIKTTDNFDSNKVYSTNVLYTKDKTVNKISFSIKKVDPKINTFMVLNDDLNNKIDISGHLVGDHYEYSLTNVDKIDFRYEDIYGNIKEDPNSIYVEELNSEGDIKSGIEFINKITKSHNKYIVSEINNYYRINSFSPIKDIRVSMLFNSYKILIENYIFTLGPKPFSSLTFNQQSFIIDIAYLSIKKYKELYYITDKRKKERIILVSTLLFYNIFKSRGYVIPVNPTQSDIISFSNKIDLKNVDFLNKVLRGDFIGI